jgi:hypothetical protein
MFFALTVKKKLFRKQEHQIIYCLLIYCLPASSHIQIPSIFDH